MTNGTPKVPATLLDFVSRHFAVVSAVLIAVGMVAAMLFVYAYLSVFDWRLIWFIEYPDLIKFGLIAIAFLSGSLFVVQGYSGTIVAAVHEKGLARWIALGALLLGLLTWFGPQFYSDVVGPVRRVGPHLTRLAAVLLFALIVLRIRNLSGNLKFSVEELISDMAVTVLFIGLLGGVFGYYVRDSQGFKETVFLEGGTLDDVGTVMFTPHHAVFYDGTKVIVVPSSRVLKIEKATTANPPAEDTPPAAATPSAPPSNTNPSDR